MIKLLLAMIFVVRFLALLIGAWQILGLLTALSWLAAPTQVTAGMWFMMGIKGVVLIVCIALLFGLARVAAGLRSRRAMGLRGTDASGSLR